MRTESWGRPRRILTPTQVADIALAISRGSNQVIEAKRYGVSRNTVFRALKRAREGEKEPYQSKPCGTNAAYERHRRNGEVACDACLEAHRIQRMNYIERDPTYKEKRRKWNEQRSAISC